MNDEQRTASGKMIRRQQGDRLRRLDDAEGHEDMISCIARLALPEYVSGITMIRPLRHLSWYMSKQVII